MTQGLVVCDVARGTYNLSGTEEQFREEDQKAVRDRLEESLYSLDFLSKIIATKSALIRTGVAQVG